MPVLLLTVIATLFTVVFTAVSIKIHGIFGTSAYDLGLFDQAFWRYSQLLPNFNTVRGMNILGDHFSPIALIFAPLYRIWPNIAWAFALQALSVAVGGIFLFKIADHLLPGRPWLCLAFSLTYYLHPAVHNTLLWQYHEIVLASGLYMALIWCYIKDRPRLFIVMLLLLLACREDMPFTLVAFGIAALLEKRWRYFLWTVVISVMWWLLVTRIAMPHFNGVGYFRASSGGLALILSNLANPSFYFTQFSNPLALDYLWKVMMPAALLGLFSPLYLLPAIPTLMVNILLGAYNTDLSYHYSVSIMPFFFWAALAGSARLTRFSETHFPMFRFTPRLIASLALVASLILGVRYSVMNIGALPSYFREWQDNAAKRSHIAALDAQLGSAGVAAGDWLLPHVSHRERCYLFPNPWKIHYWGINGENPHHPNVIQYIVIDKNDIRANQPLYDYLVDNGIFSQVSDKCGIITLKRMRPEAADRARAITDFIKYTPIAPPAFTNTWISPGYSTTESEFRRLDLDPASVKAPIGSTSLPDQQPGALMDMTLGEDGKSDFTTRYVHTNLVSNAACPATLHLGSDDGITVWLNGQQVHENIVLRPAQPDQDIVAIKLKTGRNTLVFRINNATGAFRMLAAIEIHPTNLSKR